MYVAQTGIASLETLIQAIATQMLAHGFKLSSVNQNTAASNVSSASKSIVLAASGIDTRSGSEPWSVILKADDVENWMSVHVLPTSQIQNIDQAPTTEIPADAGAGTDAYIQEAGRVSPNSDQSKYFIHRTKQWTQPVGVTGAGYPISFYLAYSDHGFSLLCWSEATLLAGTDFSWLVCQRGVLPQTLALPATKSPVIALFSTARTGNPTVLNPEEVQRFTVIEDDVNVATQPVSAVVASSGYFPILNPMQQTTIAADDTVLILLPQCYNTQRHIYFLVLDLLACTSAEAVSMSSTVPVAFASGNVNYQALIANGVNNTGMRILLPM